MKVIPLNDKVLVKRLDAEEKSAGGILLPDSAREKPRTGKVLAVGEGGLTPAGVRRPVPVQVGDKVLFSPYGGTEIKIEGEEYLLMTGEDLLAVLA